MALVTSSCSQCKWSVFCLDNSSRTEYYNNYIVHHSSGIIIVIGTEYKLFNYCTMSIAKVDGANGITDLSIKQRAFTQ